jgi:hypothetical protein
MTSVCSAAVCVEFKNAASTPAARDLVFHERDERRDDDRQPVEHQGRDLVTERFAAAGRHQHEAVFFPQDGLDRRLLVQPERVVAELAFEDFLCASDVHLINSCP